MESQVSRTAKPGAPELTWATDLHQSKGAFEQTAKPVLPTFENREGWGSHSGGAIDPGGIDPGWGKVGQAPDADDGSAGVGDPEEKKGALMPGGHGGMGDMY